MTRVFIDTSALIALLDADDPRHPAVRATLLDLAARELVTTGYVVAESIAVARRRFGVDGAVALIDDILPLVEILPVDPASHVTALKRYRASLPTGTSFVDELSFHVIEREQIPTAFALDTDFASVGVEILPVEPRESR